MATAPDNGHRKATPIKFPGHKAVIRVDLYLNLFEVETRGQTGEAWIPNLMRYPTDDALNFFASDIASIITNLDWAAVGKLVTVRFGIAILHPLVEAKNRYLKYSEIVHKYYEDKLRLSRFAKLDINAILTILTEENPAAYRNHLACYPATTPSE